MRQRKEERKGWRQGGRKRVRDGATADNKVK